MANKLWKLNMASSTLFKKALILKITNKLEGRNKIIFKKSDIITKNFNNTTFLVYKGCFYRKLYVNKFIHSYRFGEFAFTRKPFRYMLKSKK